MGGAEQQQQQQQHQRWLSGCLYIEVGAITALRWLDVPRVVDGICASIIVTGSVITRAHLLTVPGMMGADLPLSGSRTSRFINGGGE
ncbi:hypothetical protein D4764_09G0002100 [Takifugu flavidus]|uniref:Uncharacterized protein n=1 Tax=Takifugu flavidus TaxID=433684 RepID=A0A5C6MLR1_9TELE|nr:hypothetical protein D4764_09G0002100 [Takifugu flavidus]